MKTETNLSDFKFCEAIAKGQFLFICAGESYSTQVVKGCDLLKVYMEACFGDEPEDLPEMEIITRTFESLNKLDNWRDDQDYGPTAWDASIEDGRFYICRITSVVNGACLIAEERDRQIRKEGWSATHDDGHADGQLVLAAVCYAFGSKGIGSHDPRHGLSFTEKYTPGALVNTIQWPWGDEFWKPSKKAIPNLVKAGALIAAEIDRLQRREAKEAK